MFLFYATYGEFTSCIVTLTKNKHEFFKNLERLDRTTGENEYNLSCKYFTYCKS